MSRAELKQLIFQKSQALKNCKSKSEKVTVEQTFQKLEEELMIRRVPTTEVVAEEPPVDVSYKTKKNKQREEKLAKQKQREMEIRELVGDGSAELALQAEEMKSIIAKLSDLQRELVQIPPDGDCLFASLQLGESSQDLRDKVAEYLLWNECEFSPFIDMPFEQYCEQIRTSQWGSDIELEVICRIFNKSIRVITAETVINFGSASVDPVFISYHERQYTSPHYNATKPIGQ